MTIKSDLSTASILERLPDLFDPNRGKPIPVKLIGATIIRVGTLQEPGLVEGGGLVIDYLPPGESSTQRVVFAFTELGMWVEFEGVVSSFQPKVD